jgi:hypothetical protein
MPVGARFSALVQTGPGAHPASCTVGTGYFLGAKSGRDVTLTPHPLQVPWSWKSRAMPLPPLWAVRPVQSLSACTVELYLYSPYRLYSLYRASVPVQGCTLRAGRSRDRIPVGGEIFCTCLDWPWGPPSLLYNGYRVFPGGKEQPGHDADPSSPSSAVGHERVEQYLCSPYGLYSLYRASVPVQ